MQVLCQELSLTISAAAADGTLTVSSTTNIYPGAGGSVIKDGVAVEVVVVSVDSATTFRTRFKRFPLGLDGYADPPDYGYANLAAYATGTFTQHSSLVPVELQFVRVNG